MKSAKYIPCATFLVLALSMSAVSKTGTISTTKFGTISTTRTGTISTTTAGTISTSRTGTISTTRAPVQLDTKSATDRFDLFELAFSVLFAW